MNETYSWRLEPGPGTPDTTAGQDGSGQDWATTTFPTQADAEAWLSQEWPQLLEAGVHAVTLVRDEEVVYGPMSLQAE